MKVKEIISKGIDKGIEVGTKIKEYMIDDTLNDLNRVFGSDNKGKEK